MVSDKFGILLKELGEALKINLEPDKNHSCLLRLKSGLTVQIEPDEIGNHLLLAADLGSVLSGKYRENLFREALKSNGAPPPLYGIFAFSKRKESLVLFDQLPLDGLLGAQVAQFLEPFIEKAQRWQDAIAKGEIPSVYSTTSASPGGLFGLMQ